MSGTGTLRVRVQEQTAGKRRPLREWFKRLRVCSRAQGADTNRILAYDSCRLSVAKPLDGDGNIHACMPPNPNPNRIPCAPRESRRPHIMLYKPINYLVVVVCMFCNYCSLFVSCIFYNLAVIFYNL